MIFVCMCARWRIAPAGIYPRLVSKCDAGTPSPLLRVSLTLAWVNKRVAVIKRATCTHFITLRRQSLPTASELILSANPGEEHVVTCTHQGEARFDFVTASNTSSANSVRSGQSRRGIGLYFVKFEPLFYPRRRSPRQVRCRCFELSST